MFAQDGAAAQSSSPAGKELLAVGLMLLAVILLYWSPDGVETAQPAGDFRQLHKLRMGFARDALFGHGRLPAWYPHELMGTPFWSNVQSFPFIPNRLILVMLFDPEGRFAYTFGITLGAVLASLFTYLYCRKLGMGVVASAAAGWSFAASGYFASRIPAGHLPLLEVFCALPLMLWAVEGMIQAMQHDRPTVRWIIALGLGSACISLAGHPQLSIYALVAAGIYALWRGTLKQAFQTGLAMGMGVGCAAFALLPMLLLIGRSTRVLDLARAENDLAMPYRRLLGFFFPWFDGAAPPVARAADHLFSGYPTDAVFWDTVCFMGWMPWLALAALAIWRLKTRKTRNERTFRAPWVFLVGLGIAGVVLSLPVVQTMLSVIPGTLLRSPARLVYLSEFSLAIALAGAVQMTLRITPARRARGVVAAIVALHAIQMIHFDRQFLMQRPSISAFKVDPINELVGSVGNGRLGADSEFNLPVKRTFDDLGFFDSIMLAKPYRFIMDLSDSPPDRNVQILSCATLGRRALSAAGVLVVLTAVHCPDLRLEGESRGVRIYSVPDAAPRARYFLMNEVRFVATEQIHEYLRNPAVDMLRVLMLPIDAQPADLDARERALPGVPGSVVYHRENSDEIVCKTTMPTRGYLRVIESWDPGWRATVDGEPAQVIPAWDALLCVYVPQGEHEVRFTYHTPGAAAGMGISIVSLLALGVYALWSRQGTAPARKSASDPSDVAVMTAAVNVTPDSSEDRG